MARVLVTGSTTGLGLAAAQELIAAGHGVVLHARSAARAEALATVAEQAEGVVVGDLGEPAEVAALAEQVDERGPFDAVIHNAGIYGSAGRAVNAAGQPLVLAVNVLAPYLLTVLVRRPERLVYLSSGMHRSGRTEASDLEWATREWSATQGYCDSKLLVTTLAFAVARRWPEVRSNAVDPGWVPTDMGGPSATDDLELGHRTQVWLATGQDRAATVTGRYWYHEGEQRPAPATLDPDLQDRLLDRLADVTGVPFP